MGKRREAGGKQVVQEFTRQVVEIVHGIPPAGRVSTYGVIAFHAGNAGGARQVARILHSSSTKHGLPWHRVVNRNGAISLPRGGGYQRQMALLQGEGVVFNAYGIIDLDRYLWWPGKEE